MKIFVPSWNGDFRIESDGEAASKLVLHEPTPREREIIGLLLHEAGRKKWTGPHPKTSYQAAEMTIPLAAPVDKTSKLLIKLTRPKKQTLTAVSFSDGKLSVVEGTDEKALTQISETVADAAKTETKDKPAAAASVRRPTPCCPDCEPGAIAPASEVLLTFLDDEQHASWAQERAIVVEGNLSGHRYLLSHRHAALGRRVGRICFDLDDQIVIHFHDRTVPPEEEVLGAKLILENREHWLRNEATALDGDAMFKNPFGDYLDGTESAGFSESVAHFTREFGNELASFAKT
jgi:hypothetical protein